MKRSEALTPLSHEHHQALFAAHEMRSADSVEAARSIFESYWGGYGEKHFRIEEEVLLPMWARFAEADPEHVARVAREHLEVRAAALAIAAGELELADFHRLGEGIHDHVRFEERVLFPLIEADLDAEQRELVGAAIVAAEKP